MDQSSKTHPEQDPEQEEDQRGKADQLVGDRIEIQRRLAKQAQETNDPAGGEPNERGVPAKEQ